MDYFYHNKSDNSKVWLAGTKAINRMGLVSELGYFTFIGEDGEEYNVMDVQACNLLDLQGWLSPLMGLACFLLVFFALGWANALFTFFLAYQITKTIMVTMNSKVQTFNNSHFQILQS